MDINQLREPDNETLSTQDMIKNLNKWWEDRANDWQYNLQFKSPSDMQVLPTIAMTTVEDVTQLFRYIRFLARRIEVLEAQLPK